MPNRADETGKCYGQLTVLGDAPDRGIRSRRHMYVQCTCGKKKVVGLSDLRSGNTVSCGCFNRKVLREKAAKLVLEEPDLPERFWKKVNKNGPVSEHRPDLGPCWFWIGPVDGGGYGMWWKIRKQVRVYVSTYTHFVGPIPKGFQLDHLCRIRACCNPFHLEAVTPRENVLRGKGHAAKNAVKTHCINGHEFTEQNTYVYAKGGGKTRNCKTCRLEALRRSRHNRKSNSGSNQV